MKFSTAAVTLLFLAFPALALAHGGNNDPNVVHACVGNRSKIVRVVATQGACRSGPAIVAETPMHWAIQGPKGADGVNGNDGTSVTFVGSFSGNQHGCANGGAIFATGSAATYVCNGVDAGGVRPAGGCFDTSNRYVNCGNGTVTDTATGLIWLRQTDCLAGVNWVQGNEMAAQLGNGDCGLSDGSSPGDWRLPTRAEWLAMMTSSVPNDPFPTECYPRLTNDAGEACYGDGAESSFIGVTREYYWSSTPVSSDYIDAWAALFFNTSTNIAPLTKTVTGSGPALVRAWPVRGGSR